jgi:hypothetical protein
MSVSAIISLDIQAVEKIPRRKEFRCQPANQTRHLIQLANSAKAQRINGGHPHCKAGVSLS